MDIEQLPGKMTSKVGGVSDLLTGQLGHIRDRTAEAVRADSDSFFKQVSKLSDKMDDTESTLRKRMDRLAQQQANRWDELTSAARRTTWPRRMFWLMVGAAAGYGAAYYADRDTGGARRNELMQKVSERAKDVGSQASAQAKQVAAQASEQAKQVAAQASEQAKQVAEDAKESARELADTATHAGQEVGQEVAAQADEMKRAAAGSAKQVEQKAASAGREVTEDAKARAKMVGDEARGAAVETAKEARPEDVPSDPRTLEQRIRSEVFGHRNDVNAVVIKIDEPGKVALKGTVPTTTSERDLLAAVSEVEGVIDVTSELSVRHT